MNRLSIKSILIISILFVLIPIDIKAEGQAGLTLILDGIYFVAIFSAWIISTLILLFILKQVRQKSLTLKQKYITWTLVLSLSLFHWTMVKFDPYPYEGLIDRFRHRELIEQNQKQDSLELIYGKPDNVIEYIYSIDSLEQGVYVWKNRERRFVRPLTTDEINGGQMDDELTKKILKGQRKE